MNLPAIILAGGRSARMGRPKLVLPLPHGSAVLGRVLDAFSLAGASPIVVVGPPRHAPGWPQLADLAERPGVQLCIPDEYTSDMRESFLIGLTALQPDHDSPPGLLLSPADTPGLTPTLVAHVSRAFLSDPTRLVIPTYDGQRGHPLALPLELARSVADLPPHLGLNALRTLHPDRVFLLDVDDPSTLDDLDTPEDYSRWSPGFGK